MAATATAQAHGTGGFATAVAHGTSLDGIFRAEQRAIFRYCLAILRNREDAEDAVQSTMASALSSGPACGPAPSRAWLFRVAHNEAIDIVRRRGRERPLPESLELADPRAAGKLDHRDRLRDLLADLGDLPDNQRGALLMRELCGLSYGEIAAALGCSETAARQSVFKARRSLRHIEHGRDGECGEFQERISSRDRRVLRDRSTASHLRHCEACRGFAAAIASRKRDLKGLFPAPGGGLAALFETLGGGPAHTNFWSSAGASTAVKGAAAVVLTAAAAGGVGSITTPEPSTAPPAPVKEIGAPAKAGAPGKPAPTARGDSRSGAGAGAGQVTAGERGAPGAVGSAPAESGGSAVTPSSPTSPEPAPGADAMPQVPPVPSSPELPVDAPAQPKVPGLDEILPATPAGPSVAAPVSVPDVGTP